MKSDQDPPSYRCHHNTNRKGQEIVTFQNIFTLRPRGRNTCNDVAQMSRE